MEVRNPSTSGGKEDSEREVFQVTKQVVLTYWLRNRRLRETWQLLPESRRWRSVIVSEGSGPVTETGGSVTVLVEG